MKIEKVSTEGLFHTYRVTVPAEVIEKEIQECLTSYGKTLKLPGFRVGKVPLRLIEQRYSVKAQEQALSNVLSTSSEKLIHDNNIKQATDPTVKIISYKPGQDLVYTYAVEIASQFVLKDFKKLSFDVLEAEIDEDRIEKELETLRKNSKIFKPLPKKRPAQEKDFVTFLITTSLEDKPLKDIENKEISIEVGQPFIFPEITQALKGAELEKELNIHHTIPADFWERKLIGKPVCSSIRVTKIEEPVPAKLDDSLAKSMNLKNLKELREKVKEQLSVADRVLSRLILKRRVLDALAEQYSFDVPKSLQDDEFNQIWKRLQDEISSAKQRGEFIDEEEIDDKTLKKEYQAIAQRRVRLGLVVAEIGQRHNIHLSEDEIRKVLMKEATRYTGHEREVLEYYHKNPKVLDRLLAPILEDKIVDFIVEQAKINKKKVSWEAFKKEVISILPTAFEDEQDNEPAPKKKQQNQAASSRKKSSTQSAVPKKTAAKKRK